MAIIVGANPGQKNDIAIANNASNPKFIRQFESSLRNNTLNQVHDLEGKYLGGPN